MTIDWNKPIELVETHSGVVVPAAEPTERIGQAAGQTYYTEALRIWGKVYLVSPKGDIQHVPEFRIRNVSEPRYRPYTPDELAALVGTAVRHKHDGVTTAVMLHPSPQELYVRVCSINGHGLATNTGLLEHYTHLNGTPCGVLEEDGHDGE